MHRLICIALALGACSIGSARPLRTSGALTTGIEKQPFHVLEYDLSGHFDWERLVLTASVDIRLKLDSEQQTQLLLDSEVSRIVSVSLAGQQGLPFAVIAPAKLQPGKLQIDLSSIPAERRKQELIIGIQYETEANSSRVVHTALKAISRHGGDPVPSRVVYTYSEPEDASMWLPCHNVPSDRALFSADFTLPVGETLVANGDLLVDEVVDPSPQGAKAPKAPKQRHMRYGTRYPLPVYLMAFAIGEFDITTKYHGALPVSIVARRGLPVDTDGLLKSIIGQIARYENLLIPYPFEKYWLVLLPDFEPSGIEHASISFQNETESTQSSLSDDLGLAAHELGHQWFGDLVTLKTWDDLWIKEGVATLLQEEAKRELEDQSHSGQLFGHRFSVDEGTPILDPTSAPSEKYNNGSYGRSAWLLTQIRSVLGEDAFWGILRQTLKKYQYGVIGTDEFIEMFRPALGEALTGRVKKALLAKALPALKVDGGRLTFQDADGSTIIPLTLRWYEENGRYQSEVLKPGETRMIKRGEKRLLVLDPQDVHPVRKFKAFGKGKMKPLLSLMVPRTSEERELFHTFSGSQQVMALHAPEEWSLTPDEFSSLYGSLASEEAKYLALQMACVVGHKQLDAGVPAEAWQTAITRAMIPPPYFGISNSKLEEGLSDCHALLPDTLFAGQWELIQKSPASAFSEPELLFLSSMPTSAELTFATWGKLGMAGGSVRSRLIGLNRLKRDLDMANPFPSPSHAQLTAWKKYFRDILGGDHVPDVFFEAMSAVRTTKDTEAMPFLAALAISAKTAKTAKPAKVAIRAACTAYLITGGDDEQWEEFVDSLGEPAQLPAYLERYLENPKLKCATEMEDEA